MATSLEDLRVLKSAELLCDGIWKLVAEWQPFARDTVGSQLARAADSIGANIAEAFGRFNFGEKVQFLYYARGSLFETKYWLNRALNRSLIASNLLQSQLNVLTDLARQLNAFVNSIKSQKTSTIYQPRSVREGQTDDANLQSDQPLFLDEELVWLQSLIPNP